MNWVRKWLVSALLVIISTTSLIGSLKQIITLKGIDNLINEQKIEIAILEAKNKQLEEKIAYTNTEEYRQRAYRWYLGLGTENDYWLDLPASHNFETVYETSEEKVAKPHWQEWWDLIVDQR